MSSRPHTSALLAASVALPALLAQVSLAEPARPSPPPKGSASASASSAAPVPAPSSLAAEIVVLHGSNTGEGIDPRIGDMPQLQKPPFSAYNTYKLLSQSRIPLAGSKPGETKLPNDSVLQIALKEALPEGRFKVATSVKSAKGSSFLPLLEVTTSLNERFFVAGQSYDNGVLWVGIRLVK